MSRLRFLELNSYFKSDSNIFFGRKEEIKQITNTVSSDTIVIYGKEGVGKTSLLQAGLLPYLANHPSSEYIFISITDYHNNKKHHLTKNIREILKKEIKNGSFIDKLINSDNSFWYYLKKIESASDKTIYLILDQFENVFSYPESEQTELKQELEDILFEQVPAHLRESIQTKLNANPNLLTSKAISKLYSKLNLKLIVAINGKKISSTNFFEKIFRNNSDNYIELKPFDAEKTTNIIEKIGSFVPKYNIDNNFSSPPFTLSEDIRKHLYKFIETNKTKITENYQLQMIGAKLEQISIEKKQTTIGTNLIKNIANIYNDYYEKIVEQITDTKQNISARKFIENELIFENENRKLKIYEGVAKQKYELNEETIQYLSDNKIITLTKDKNNENFIELHHSSLIVPILLAKEKRIHEEIHIQEKLEKKNKLEAKAKLQQEKTKRNKKIAVFFSILFIIAMCFAFFAMYQKGKAEKNEKIANSTLYASYAFQYLSTNPTLSYRLSEQAYIIDNNNVVSQRAFFNAFYKTNIFYKNNAELKNDIQKAFWSKDCSVLLVIEPTSYSLITKSGQEIFTVTKEKDILSVCFSADNSSIFLSYADSSIVELDTSGQLINHHKINSLGRNIVASASDSLIAVGCSDNNLYLFDRKMKLTKIFTGHDDQIIDCNFSENSEYIISTGLDNKILVWNMRGEIIGSHSYITDLGFRSGVIELADMSPNNKYAFFVMNDYLHKNYTLKIWDIEYNKIIYKSDNFGSNINSAHFIDNNNIIVSDNEHTAYLSNLTTQSTKQLLGHSAAILDIKYDNKNDQILSVSRDKTIKQWTIFNYQTPFKQYSNPNIIACSNSSKLYAVGLFNKFELISELKTYFSIQTQSAITNIVFSNNDNLIATTHQDSTVQIWDRNGNKITQIINDNPVLCTRINENKNLIFIATKSNYYFYNKTGKLINKYTFSEEMSQIDICFKTKNICSFSQDSLHITNYKSGNYHKIFFKNPTSIQFINNGKKLIASNKNSILITNKNLEQTTKIDTPNKILFVASNSGEKIAWTDNSQNCHLLNNDGKELYNFKHYDYIIDLFITPNEKLLYSKCIDMSGNVKILPWFISISDIIYYINDIKLFGEVQNFTPEELSQITNTNL